MAVIQDEGRVPVQLSAALGFPRASGAAFSSRERVSPASLPDRSNGSTGGYSGGVPEESEELMPFRLSASPGPASCQEGDRLSRIQPYPVAKGKLSASGTVGYGPTGRWVSTGKGGFSETAPNGPARPVRSLWDRAQRTRSVLCASDLSARVRTRGLGGQTGARVSRPLALASGGRSRVRRPG